MHEPAIKPRRPGVLRMLGVGALGFIGGALVALFIQDLVAVALIGDGDVHVAASTVFASLLPVVAIATAVGAVIVDWRSHTRRVAHSPDA